MARLLALAFLIPAIASADVVRVAITRGSRVVVEGEHLVITGGEGAPMEADGRLTLESSGSLVEAHGRRDARFRIEEATGGAIKLNGVPIIGAGEVAAVKGGLVGIDVIDLERYVASVVGAEMPSNWPAAALEAQAIAARTYVLSRRQKVRSDQPFDVEATVRSQVYTGESTIDTRSLAAAEATRGEVLTFDGALAETYFFASCAGHTESALEAFGKASPYLVPVACGADGEKGIAWSHPVAARRLSTLLGVRDVSEIEIVRRTQSGRIARVAIHSHSGERHLSGVELRTAIGSAMPSLDVAITRHGSEFIFSGHGAGHGVGLCQWGARDLALKGETATEILRHYYPGTRLDAQPVESRSLVRVDRN